MQPCMSSWIFVSIFVFIPSVTTLRTDHWILQQERFSVHRWIKCTILCLDTSIHHTPAVNLNILSGNQSFSAFKKKDKNPMLLTLGTIVNFLTFQSNQTVITMSSFSAKRMDLYVLQVEEALSPPCYSPTPPVTTPLYGHSTHPSLFCQRLPEYFHNSLILNCTILCSQ